ncbi:MAG TPA: hypothetical protein VHF47_09715 [Acidimicrobiales bacterium]|nr:hypothetical protein [Acidimicrobiales bacterium]
MTPFFTVRRAVISLLLAASVVGLVVAFTMHEETEPLRVTHAAVRVVSPANGEQSVPRQSTVFVELEGDYTLDALQLQGQAVGGADVEHIPGLNRWSFSPGEGKSIERLPGGRTCAVAEFHRTGGAPASERYAWCFFVN